MIQFYSDGELVGKYEIFSDFKDRLRWHKLIDFIDTVDHLNDHEKDRIKKSYIKLSQILGRNFLLNGHKTNHSLCQRFINLAPDALKWTIWLADTLEGVEKINNGKVVINRVKSNKYTHEGMAILQLFDLFQKVGFSLEFEPKIKVKEKNKFPDLKLTSNTTNKIIFIEVSNLNISDKHGDNSSFSRITKVLRKDAFKLDLHFCGEIVVEDSDVAKAINIIEHTKIQAIENTSFIEIDQIGIKLGMAHQNELEKLKSWANRNETRVGSLSGGSVSLDSDIQRMKNKIKRKTQQLSEDYINIIVIPTHHLFMLVGDKFEMFKQVGEYLGLFPKIYGVLVYGNNQLAKPNIKEVLGNHIIANHQVCQDINSYMFIHNERCDKKMDDHLWKLFHSAFDVPEVKTLTP
ncbi:MAG: hypothetical protein ACNS60_17400 [Candidatus Cyclobacteriaceae bacterium M2_1C_046]